MKNTFRADIISDTISPLWRENRLITMVVNFPRYILPEVNTHRVFSRNSASSRARSIRDTITQVMEDPYVPIFTRNQKGMSGEKLSGKTYESAKRYWLHSRDEAVKGALSLLLGASYNGSLKYWREWIDVYYEDIYKNDESSPEIPNVHKQNVNRLLEPFMWHEAIITSSYWDNFFNLRLAPQAQPEIQVLAGKMKKAIDDSDPVHSHLHIPFVNIEEPDSYSNDEIGRMMMISAARCAKISYHNTEDQNQADEESLIAMATKLYGNGHMSPFEHQAIATDRHPMFLSFLDFSGNLDPVWAQFRHILMNETTRDSFGGSLNLTGETNV